MNYSLQLHNYKGPNLPYFYDGALKLTESTAIMRYLCHKYDPKLMGTNLEEMAKIDMVAGVISDLISYKSAIMYAPDPNAIPQMTKDRFANTIKDIAKVLENRKHLAGDKLSYVDFVCMEALESINELVEPIFKTYPILEHYYKSMINIPSIYKYRNSEQYLKNPRAYNGKMARLGNAPIKH